MTSKLLIDCLTEKDGVTWCPFRILGCILSILVIPAFIVFQAISVWYPDHHFDAVSYGAAYGAMLAGLATLAGGIAFKQRGEPDHYPDSPPCPPQ